MATYRFTNATAASLELNERPIYGSSRLGSYVRTMQLYNAQAITSNPPPSNIIQRPDLRYELTDHLGNVAAVVTGRLLPSQSLAPNEADLLSAQGYEPFGALLPGRNYSSGSYRYLFQGQEHDDEINGSVGTSYAFEYRIHDSRIGRFLSIDPLAAKYPFYSPYAFSGNRVIDAVELEGLEPAGLNTMNGTYTTANDANSQYGQWDSQVIYPSGGPAAIGGSDSKFLATLWSLDRSMNLSGSEKQYEMKAAFQDRLAGGFKMVDYSNSTTGSNNADRKGDPERSWDVTGIKARADVNPGRVWFGTTKMPGHGEGWVANAPDGVSSGSGAAGEYANLVKAKADQSESAPVIRVSSASSSYKQARANAVLAHTGGTGGPIVRQMDSGWNPLNGLVWQDQTMSDGAHKYFTWNNETKVRVEVTLEQFTAGSK